MILEGEDNKKKQNKIKQQERRIRKNLEKNEHFKSDQMRIGSNRNQFNAT